jgi:hypothetical protein
MKGPTLGLFHDENGRKKFKIRESVQRNVVITYAQRQRCTDFIWAIESIIRNISLQFWVTLHIKNYHKCI